MWISSSQWANGDEDNDQKQSRGKVKPVKYLLPSHHLNNVLKMLDEQNIIYVFKKYKAIYTLILKFNYKMLTLWDLVLNYRKMLEIKKKSPNIMCLSLIDW